ncbi:hypothetical protein [Demequina rhizosphaerae]|uniref:hypothetical protein n=1 Tax=Demequina rhizosphaerae TaxID=1638985 RepID=UPI0007807E7C|nr:hypothetical protein [Demequina rhizosphaerae]
MSQTTATDERTGRLRGTVAGLPRDLTGSQKLMVFVLSMALSGVANLVLEIIPDVTIGPVDVSVSYFVFVPLALVALLNPFWAALGAPIGEVIFVDLLMGDFSGLAEIEGIIQMFLALYIAGSLVRNPRNRLQIAIAAVTVVVIDKALSALVDLSKVWIGVEDAEFVEGLPESILLLEGIGYAVDILMSGVLFGVIPAIWLIPALHGRIEPLLGMRPRVPGEPIQGSAPRNAMFVAIAVALSVASFLFAFLEAWDIELGVFEPEWLDTYGPGFIWVGVGAAAIAFLVGVALARLARRNAGSEN